MRFLFPSMKGNNFSVFYKQPCDIKQTHTQTDIFKMKNWKWKTKKTQKATKKGKKDKKKKHSKEHTHFVSAWLLKKHHAFSPATYERQRHPLQKGFSFFHYVAQICHLMYSYSLQSSWGLHIHYQDCLRRIVVPIYIILFFLGLGLRF